MRDFLKTLLAGAAAAAAGALAFWAGAAMADDGNPAAAVQCANGGKRPIVAVYTSPPGRSDWSDDMLGKGTLKPGKTMKLTLKAKPAECKVDVSALLDNGDTLTKTDIDLCASDPRVAFADR